MVSWELQPSSILCIQWKFLNREKPLFSFGFYQNQHQQLGFGWSPFHLSVKPTTAKVRGSRSQDSGAASTAPQEAVATVSHVTERNEVVVALGIGAQSEALRCPKKKLTATGASNPAACMNSRMSNPARASAVFGGT